MEFKRFAELKSSTSYLLMNTLSLDGSGLQKIKLNSVPDEESNTLLAQTSSESGAQQVRFRKAAEGKDIFIEVWNDNGIVSTLKVTDKMSKVMNDVVFGGIKWSVDGRKIVFVGEVAEIASYKNPWD